MCQKISNPPLIKAVNHCGWVFPLIAITLCVSIFFFLGCAGNGMAGGTGIKTADDKDETVYQITEQSALELAQWALEQTWPDQKVHRLKKPRLGFFVHEHEQKGHYKYARFRDATFIYEVDLLRMRGRTAQGQSVVGYTYALKGVGDLKTGPGKLTQLTQHLKDGFEKTGRAVMVSSLRPEKPEPPVIAPGASPASDDAISTEPAAEKPTVKEAPAAVVPMTTTKEQPLIEEDDDVFAKLKKLKELLDQGIITEEEFQVKKKELLDRI